MSFRPFAALTLFLTIPILYLCPDRATAGSEVPAAESVPFRPFVLAEPANGTRGLQGTASPRPFGRSGGGFPPLAVVSDRSILPKPFEPGPPRIAGTPDTLRAVALMVEFPADDDGSTTGDGTFSSVIDANVLIFGAEFPSFDTLGNLIDVDTFDVAHDARYFREQLAYVTQYYREVSYGLQEVSFDLLDSVFVAGNPMAYYGLDDSLGVRQPRLLREVVEMADGAVDFSAYDAVYIVHAGVGQETDVFGDSEGDLWTTYYSRFDLADALADSGETDSYRGITTNDTDASGDTFHVNEIALIPESETQDGFAQWLLGVACHMTGRVLGAPSLFDPTPPSFPNSQGIGNFGIMGTGLWNSGGILPSPPCVWTKTHLGWIDPLVVRNDTTLSLAMIETANDSLPIAVRVPITESEYYLLSNRWPDQNGDGRFTFTDVDGDNVLGIFEDSYVGAEFDWSIPEEGSTNGAGLFIWHIDEDVIRRFGDFRDVNRVNAESERKGVDLEEADGLQDLDTRARELNNFGSEFDSWTLSNPSFDGPVVFGPHTIPDTRTNFGAATGIEIEVLSESGPVIEVAIRFGRDENAWLREAPGERTRLTGPVTFGATEDEFLYAVYDSTTDSTWVFRVDADGEGLPKWPVRIPAKATFAPIGAFIEKRSDKSVYVPTEEGMFKVTDDESRDDTLFVLVGNPPAPSGSFFIASRVLSSDMLSRQFVFGEDDSTFASMFGPPLDFSRLYDAIGRGTPVAPPVLVGQDDPYFLRFVATSTGLFEQSVSRTSEDREASLVLLSDSIRFPPQLIVSDSNAEWSLPEFTVIADGGTLKFADSDLPFRTVFLSATITGAPALGQLDGDAEAEVVCGTADGFVHAYNVTGAPVSNWPVRLRNETLPNPNDVPVGTPAIADFDGDGRNEVAVTTESGGLYLIEGNGRIAEGYPVATAGRAPFGPLATEHGLLVATESGALELIPFVATDGALEGTWSGYQNSRVALGSLPGVGLMPVATTRSFTLNEAKTFVYPNPVRGSDVKIYFEVGGDTEIDVTIYDASGALVATLPRARVTNDTAEIVWECADETSGLYAARLEARSLETGETKTKLIPFAILR